MLLLQQESRVSQGLNRARASCYETSGQTNGFECRRKAITADFRTCESLRMSEAGMTTNSPWLSTLVVDRRLILAAVLRRSQDNATALAPRLCRYQPASEAVSSCPIVGLSKQRH